MRHVTQSGSTGCSGEPRASLPPLRGWPLMTTRTRLVSQTIIEVEAK